MNVAFVNALADALLPGDGHWPSGGSVDLATTVESIGGLVPGHTRSLGDLELLVGTGFAELPVTERATVLKRVEGERPDLFGVARLVVFDAYYRHPRVLEVMADRCGYRAEPPQPSGFAVDDFDPSALSTVRTMAKRWRDDTVPAS